MFNLFWVYSFLYLFRPQKLQYLVLGRAQAFHDDALDRAGAEGSLLPSDAHRCTCGADEWQLGAGAAREGRRPRRTGSRTPRHECVHPPPPQGLNISDVLQISSDY